MKKLLYILSIFLFSSCQKEIFDINNLNGDILVIGHGGMGVSHSYPINTFESIMHCINLGTDGTEIDVQMTKDGVLVAFHDKELSNKTNKYLLLSHRKKGNLKKKIQTKTHY